MWITDYIKYEELYKLVKSRIRLSVENECDHYCTFLTDTIYKKDNWCNLFGCSIECYGRYKECKEMFGKV